MGMIALPRTQGPGLLRDLCVSNLQSIRRVYIACFERALAVVLALILTGCGGERAGGTGSTADTGAAVRQPSRELRIADRRWANTLRLPETSF